MISSYAKYTPPRIYLPPHSAQAERARRRILPFTLFTKPSYDVNWHHQVVADALDRFIAGEIRRLMIFMPPRHGKSELVSRRLPAYILGRNPNAQIIACSYSASLAQAMNRDVQRIIDSPAYASLFPNTRLNGSNVRTTARDSYLRNSDIFEVVGHSGFYRAAGVGGPITGTGFSHGIIDDPIKNREEADSPTYRKKVFEWYTDVFYNRQEKDAGILLTVTRWHEDDLPGRLLRLAEADPEVDQWVVISLPAIAEQPRPPDPRQVGDALWPGKYPLPRLKRMRATMGARAWISLYQQRPSPDEGGILQKGWFRYYLPSQLPTLDQFDELSQSWDMTFKDGAGTDFVVGQVWGRIGADAYLLHQVRERMDFPTTLDAVEALSAAWERALKKLVEDKANGPAVIAALRHRVPGLIPVTPQGSKVARASAVAPVVRSGNVYLPALALPEDGPPVLAPWVQEFLHEVAAFPQGTFDDQVDAMTQQLAEWYVPTSEEEYTEVGHLEVERVDLSGWDR